MKLTVLIVIWALSSTGNSTISNSTAGKRKYFLDVDSMEYACINTIGF